MFLWIDCDLLVRWLRLASFSKIRYQCSQHFSLSSFWTTNTALECVPPGPPGTLFSPHRPDVRHLHVRHYAPVEVATLRRQDIVFNFFGVYLNLHHSTLLIYWLRSSIFFTRSLLLEYMQRKIFGSSWCESFMNILCSSTLKVQVDKIGEDTSRRQFWGINSAASVFV